MQTVLPWPVAPAMSMCGKEARSAIRICPPTSWPSASGSAAFDVDHAALSSSWRSTTGAAERLGTSMPTTPLPGIGAWTRMLSALSASVMLLARLPMRSIFTFAAGSSS